MISVIAPSAVSVLAKRCCARSLLLSSGTIHRRLLSSSMDDTATATPPPLQGPPTTTTTTTSSISSSSSIQSSLQRPPNNGTAKHHLLVVPPGKCQFNETFQSAELVEKVRVSPSSSLFRFRLPDVTQPLQLSTCACILAKANIIPRMDGEEEGGENDNDNDGLIVVRPYTPISTNALVGYMDLLVKNYFEKGTMSRYLHNLEIGDDQIQFKHIEANVKIQAPFFVSPSAAPQQQPQPQQQQQQEITTAATTKKTKHIVMLTGGSGITPMIQALHAILDKNGGDHDHDQGGGSSSSSTDDQRKVTLIYGSQRSDDILARDLLEEWANEFDDMLEVVHVLSEEPTDSDWTGHRGMIDQSLLEQYLPAASAHRPDTLIMVCGPPPMYEALSGPRDDRDSVGGILGDLGYTMEQVYKF